MRNGVDDRVVTNASMRPYCTGGGTGAKAVNELGTPGRRECYSQPMMISPGFTIKITLLPS